MDSHETALFTFSFFSLFLLILKNIIYICNKNTLIYALLTSKNRNAHEQITLV